MTIIGNFKKQNEGFEGSISTLTLSKKVTISPVEKTSARAPIIGFTLVRMLSGCLVAISQRENPISGSGIEDPLLPPVLSGWSRPPGPPWFGIINQPSGSALAGAASISAGP